MERIRPIKSLLEFFKDSVAAAMYRQQVDADDHTSYYVVNLLTLFARSEVLFDDTEDGRELTPIARVLADAVDADRSDERNFALQRVGDVSLFVAGFLGDGLAAKPVDVDYYVRVGGAAYGTLAQHATSSFRGRVFSGVFAELAEKFQDFVDVLADIRDAGHVSEQDTLRIYESWLLTGSKRAARALRARGIEPNLGSSGDTRH